MIESSVSARRLAIAAFAVAVSTLVGCGDVRMFKLNPGSDDGTAVDAAISGVDIRLSRYSASCEAGPGESLVAKVGDGVGFDGEQVKSLTVPCLGATTPGVEIYVEPRSIVFDFSNVERPGRFPQTDFEGFLFDIVRDADTPLLVAAAIDRTATNVDLDDEELTYDYDYLEIDFAGAEYTADSFVKINLFFGIVNASN